MGTHPARYLGSAFGGDERAAIVEVAREYLGFAGVIVILLDGLLATFSSATASILGASWALYGLSADALVPQTAARVRRTCRKAHFAPSFVAGATIVLAVTGRTAVLAEVASFLHLVMYGLMCAALAVLRRRDPEWYDPGFECPGHPAVPVVGGVASLALIAFMQPASRVLGGMLVLVDAGWYLPYARDVELNNRTTDGRPRARLPSSPAVQLRSASGRTGAGGTVAARSSAPSSRSPEAECMAR